MKANRHEAASAVQLPPAAKPPPNVDAALFAAARAMEVSPDPDAMRLCKAIAAGQLAELVVRIDKTLAKGGEAKTRRSVVGVWQTKLPRGSTVWINDATSTAEDIEICAGRSVIDATPDGSVKAIHGAVQIPRDVTQSTSSGAVLAILRGILAANAASSRVGVITHQVHLPSIAGTAKKGRTNLEDHFRGRIAKTAYFRRGDSRGSNGWTEQCDLLIVLGTPRIPPAVIREHLIRLGRVGAAARSDDWVGWGDDYWSAETISGKRRTVKCLGYRDHDWHAAHRSLVAAELIQCVGRSRSICEHGIPVTVVTTEQLGLKVVDSDPQPVSEAAAAVFAAMQRLSERSPTGVSRDKLSERSPTIYYLGDRSVSSSSLATVLKQTDRWVRRLLGELSSAGLVTRVGQRGGWILSRPAAIHEDERSAAAGADRLPEVEVLP